MKLYECVPNFSEGRDPAKVHRIADAGRSVGGATVLDVESNSDHNRSVITLVGEAEPLLEAVFRMCQVAVETIDLNTQKGEHPRMGAVDVVPFVPIGEATVADAIALSQRLADRLWRELRLPVYLYAQSARTPERSDLSYLRRGEFEGIRDSIATDPARRPDVGDAMVHPTAGIVAVGARPVLIAYNIYLGTPDVSVAKEIAKLVREKDGGLPAVRALGFDIKERAQAQVSMNLIDYHTTPVHAAFQAVVAEAAKRHVDVVESEVVGLIPEDALLDAALAYLKLTKFDRAQILERKLRAATPAGSASLAQLPVASFVSKMAEKTPTPGGGSAAACAAAMGAALGEMVIQYSRKKDVPDAALDQALATFGKARVRFLELIDADAESYAEVRRTSKERKNAPDDPGTRARYRAAIRHAAEVPLETGRLALETIDLLNQIHAKVKPIIMSDHTSALGLLAAARDGAAANVQINLDDLKAEGIDTAVLESELKRLKDAGT
jgi:glutamate formiminotransferase/formiminotetrahydrofolate cyclodeaminase